MRLSEILKRAGLTVPPLVVDPEIHGITADSRAVRPGMIFAALPGVAVDGATFIPQALAQGASALLASDAVTPAFSVPCVSSSSPRHALALMAALLAGPQPAHIAAVTGTNGKSSTADFLRQFWSMSGNPAASIGTLGLISDIPVEAPPPLTTPDAVSMAQTLAQLKAAGINHVALEASSHGLDQHRLDGVRLGAGGFCNLTRDHLDYHGTMDAYRTAKLRLFADLLPDGAIAAFNADMDAQTVTALRDLAQARRLKPRSVGEQGETIRLLNATPLPHGQIVSLALFGEKLPDLTIGLTGRFQVDNVLLAASMIWAQDDQARGTLDLIPHLQGVRGRAELAVTLDNGAGVYVDYAHTPDALDHLLHSLRPHAQNRLIVVFGAGGDRDRGKRPLMGGIAAKLADLAIVTDDNPRSEDPASIRAAIRAACPDALEIGDRRAAIAAALSEARLGDVVVVAGKGHESGQTVAGVTTPFDDRAVIRELAGVPA
ncbi:MULTISPECIES: UDP-N-acetylmuramoyl-L-alanyl-D-glutamate--2,6-diaminopimelate ligase [Asaia]|uniref:UDP-N-acetylmuramoyl-L-alanyl-D-glutamate--2, 6-diaminopimelate ligase n=1 Tax=Asaia TaxID=91914 RepID=UPI0025556B07|nr:UDP-N-acetylmuramoyl-L-alanyl-D-glutamate--2,6-diaminopimelate ligase [Asaia sp. HumB]MDL2172089.1 UDP-N-acetylmuramoyl-L-alanyl-D-glutamate--2,6-diaminopimelate ligase [Asaia sp. HumB]